MVWFIALKAGIFPEFAAFREVHLLLISQFLVMAFAFNGGTQARNLARRFVGDDIILYCVALLLARVIRLLAGLVFGTTNGSLGTIDDEFKSRTSFQYGFDISRRAGWQLQVVAECGLQYRT